MTSKRRVRKESGRKYNKFYNPELGQYYMIYWDDWQDYRDGQRDAYSDSTLKQPKCLSLGHWGRKPVPSINKRIYRLLERRIAMRNRKK